MQAIKNFIVFLTLGFLLTGCGSNTNSQADSAGDTVAKDSAALAAEAMAAAAEVPPFNADQVSIAVQACDRMSSIINEQILTKEYELSQSPNDKDLAQVVDKLKEYQVRFSQVKPRISGSTEENWPDVYRDYQAVGIESKGLLKTLINMGTNPQ